MKLFLTLGTGDSPRKIFPLTQAGLANPSAAERCTEKAGQRETYTIKNMILFIYKSILCVYQNIDWRRKNIA